MIEELNEAACCVTEANGEEIDIVTTKEGTIQVNGEERLSKILQVKKMKRFTNI